MDFTCRTCLSIFYCFKIYLYVCMCLNWLKNYKKLIYIIGQFHQLQLSWTVFSVEDIIRQTYKIEDRWYTVFTMKCEFIGMDFATFKTYLILKNTFKFTYCQGHFDICHLFKTLNILKSWKSNSCKYAYFHILLIFTPKFTFE